MGCGVSDGNYDWEYHHARVDTKIISPNGRIDEVFSEDYEYPQLTGLYPYARAEAVLDADFDDLGNYRAESRHTSACPMADFGLTSFTQTVALKQSAYRLIDESNTGGRYGYGYCGYGRVCIGACAVGAFDGDKRYPGPCPRRIQCQTLWAGGTCFHDTRVCSEILRGGECDP